MMFRDSYRSDNEKITPDPALLHCISVKMNQEKEASEEPESEPARLHKHYTLTTRSFVTIAACAAIALTGIVAGKNAFWGSNTGLPVKTTASDVSSPVTYDPSHLVATDYSYKQLYELIHSMTNTPSDSKYAKRAGAINGNIAVTEGAAASAAPASGTEYSNTNVQVDGVDEADIIKTDGKYIYTLSNDGIVIVSAENGNVTKLSEITYATTRTDLPVLYNPAEMFIRNDRLIVIEHATSLSATPKEGTVCADTAYWGGNRTAVAVYDIADRTNPTLLSRLGQSGSYLSSRMVGDTLYVISNYYLIGNPQEEQPETFAPLLYKNDAAIAVEASDICISVNAERPQYLVVTSMDVQHPEQLLSVKSVLGCGSTLYANANNLLIASRTSKTESVPESETSKDNETSSDTSRTRMTSTSSTDLILFSLSGGSIELAATNNVPGSLLNQFSMDEYNGTFRIVSTVSTTSYTIETQNGYSYSRDFKISASTNALYTLSSKLEVIGSITDVAPGERVYSVRFVGSIGYFVTFRQVDPLFTVDLSDPHSPKILSALKIPGLSDYLHPYSSGLLFGLGRDADEQTGRVNGLKLSMFDVSDPGNVTEKNKLLLEEKWSEASYNHKAILVSADRQLIAFPADEGYLIYSYTDQGFAKKAAVTISDNGAYSMRGLFIGDVFYVCTNTSVSTFSMSDFSQLGALSF